MRMLQHKGRKTALTFIVIPMILFHSKLCLALNTATLSVSATVQTACNFNTTSYSMPFGDYNSTDQTVPVTLTVPLTFNCNTLVSTATISLDAGANSSGGAVSARHMLNGTTNLLSYDIFVPTFGYSTSTAALPGTCTGASQEWGSTSNGQTMAITGPFSTGGTLTINMCGSIPAGQGQPPLPSGAYNDIVNMTITAA